MTSEADLAQIAQRLAGLSVEQRRRLARLAIDEAVIVLGAPDTTGQTADETSGRFEPSDIQRLMWHLAADGQDAAYTFTSRQELTGPLNLPALRHAVSAVRRHHQILRVTLREEATGLVAVDEPSEEATLRVVDITALDPTVQSSLIEAHRPSVDLRGGRVMDVVVFRLTADRALLLMSLHHAAYDDWSLPVLAEDLATGYEAAVSGRPAVLPPSVDYEHYVSLETAALNSPQLGAAATMWSERVADAMPTHVPVDHHRPGSTGAWSSVRSVPTPAVDARSRELLCSRAAYVMAAVGRIVARWCGTPGATLTVPVANRADAGLMRTVGNLTNMVPLVVPDADAETSAAAVQRQLAEQTSHLIVPYRAMEAAGLIEGSSLGALSSVLCLMASPRPDFGLAGLRVRPSQSGPLSPLAPVVVEIVPEGETALDLAVHLDQAAFASETADRLVDAIEAEVLGRSQAPAEAVDGAVIPAFSWGLHMDRLLRDEPDWVIAVDGVNNLTRRGLAARGEELLTAAAVTGDVPTVIGLHLPRGVDYLALLVAVLRSGRTAVPLDVDLPTDRLLELVQRRGVELVFSDDPDLRDLGPKVVSPAHVSIGVMREVPQSVAVHGQGSPVTLATSGSTGSPLLVDTTWDALHSRLAWATSRLSSGEHRVLGRTPIGFVDSLAELIGPLCARSRVDIVSDDDVRDPARLVDRVVAGAVTSLTAVPTLLSMAVGGLGRDGSGIEQVVSSGEPLPAGLADQLRRGLPRANLVDSYGASETGGDNLVVELDGRAGAGTFAQALPGSCARVLAPNLEPVAARSVGQLAIGGATLARGYHGDARRTSERFRPAVGAPGGRIFLTGDRATPGTDGIAVIGRLDGQINVRGTRVDPSEVEWHLREISGCSECIVGVTDDGRAQELIAVLAGLPAADVDVDRLRRRLRQRLPTASCPARFYCVDDLPRTASGKLARRRLSELIDGLQPLVARSGGPYRGFWERLVGECFEHVLELGDLGRLAHFFDLGGHSVAAADLVALIRRRVGREIGLADLLASPIVAELAVTVAARPVANDGGLPASPGSAIESFPLTAVQRAYLVGRSETVSLGGVGSHAYSEHDFADLDVVRLAAALDQLIARHEMLRVVIESPDEQRVLAVVPPMVIETEDLTALDDEHRAERLLELRDSLSHRVWREGDWPLFDVRATVIDATTTRVHFSVDAMICDVASYSILVDELRRLYDDPQADLPPIGRRFADVVRDRLTNRSARRAAESYWERRIPSLPPGPDLPTAPPGSPASTRRFERLSAKLDEVRWRRLGERARAMAVTPSALVLTAFGDVLARWCQRGHFTVVLTTFDRPTDLGLECLVGDFTSLVLVEVQAATDAPIEDRAGAIQRELWSGLDHAALDGVEVIGRWARHHERAADGSMPVVFTSTIDIGTQPSGGGPLLDGDEVFAITQTPQVLLDHQVGVVDGVLRFNWDYVPSAFPVGMIDDMWESYLAFLDELSSPTSQPRVELPVRQEDELLRANDTRGPVAEEPLHAEVFRRLAEPASGLAIVSDDQAMTYEDLAHRVAALTLDLTESDVGRGSVAAIDCPKGVDQVVAVLAASRVGATWLPIDPELPTARRDLLIEIGRPDTVLTSDPRRVLGGVPVLDVSAERPPASIDSLSTIADPLPDDPAYIIFTSGTTGVPKGVVISHRAARNTVDDISRRFDVTSDDRVLGLSALSFDLAVYDIFGTLAVGGTLVLPPPESRRNPAHWLRLCAESRVTVWNSVPALMQLALEADADRSPSALGSLRLAMLSGDWVPPSLEPALRRRVPGLRVVSLGGATEASIWSVFHPIDEAEPDWTSVPYGFPLTNQTLHVLDPTGRDRPEWVAGELHIGGLGVATEYLGDPNLTAERFRIDGDRGRLYRTGDLARRRPGGILEFLGRADGQVKISGMRLELGEVEAALRDDPDVGDALVTAIEEADRSKRLVAYVVGRPGRPVETASIRARLRTRLPTHAVPGFIVVLDRLPLTANGKVDRQALPDPRNALSGEADQSPAISEHVGDVEAVLSEVWADALGVPSIAPTVTFWEAGGTSAIAISMMRVVGQRLDRDLTLGLLYEHPTITRLALALGEQGAGDRHRPDHRQASGAADEPFPLTAVQEAYWMGRRAGFELAGASAHNYFELDVVDLDLATFQRSLSALVVRHAMLRTVIRPDGTQQTLAEVPDFEVPVIDLRGLDPPLRDERLLALREQWAHRRYDPERWPLFGVRALPVDDRTTRLQVSIDLIVVDTHCLLIIQRDLLRIYDNGGVDPSPPLACTFREYVMATRVDRTSARYERDLAYWDEVADALPPPPALPLRGHTVDFEPVFERLEFQVAADRWTVLKALAAGNDVTPTAFLLSALGDVILQWSGWRPFTLNLPTLSRVPIHPDIEDVVGDFTSTTLVAVAEAAGDVMERARDIQSQLWAAIDHGSLSGVEVLRRRRQRNPNAPLLMPIVFTSQLDYPTSSEEELPALEVKRVYGLTQTAQVLLDAQASEHDGILFFSVDYVPLAFADGVVTSMVDRLQELLEELAP